MRLLLLLVVAGGCTSMTIRSGVVSYGGRPAFQASIEIGPSVYGKTKGFSIGSQWGIESDERGTRAVTGGNVELIQTEEDTGPIARIGAGFRNTLTKDERDQTGGFVLHGAAYVGFGRGGESSPQFGGLGIEIGGGFNVTPTVEPIFEANLVFGGKADK